MSWNDYDDKTKKEIDKQFVSCDEKYELDVFRNQGFSDESINCACKNTKAPRPRQEFEEALKKCNI